MELGSVSNAINSALLIAVNRFIRSVVTVSIELELSERIVPTRWNNLQDVVDSDAKMTIILNYIYEVLVGITTSSNNEKACNTVT
jgi:hypothetical protein